MTSGDISDLDSGLGRSYWYGQVLCGLLRPGDGSCTEMSLHLQGPLSEDLETPGKVKITVVNSTACGRPQLCRKLPYSTTERVEISTQT